MAKTLQSALLSNPLCTCSQNPKTLTKPLVFNLKKNPDLEHNLFHSSILKLLFLPSPTWEPSQLIHPSPSVSLVKHHCPAHPGSSPPHLLLLQHSQKTCNHSRKFFLTPKVKNSQSLVLILHVILQPPVLAAPHCLHTTHKLWHTSAPSTPH